MPRPSRENPSAEPASIQEVADRAGVSIATVSRILNNPALVAPATAARVRAAIEELGYRPNRFAQGLMTRRSHVLGILLPDIHGEFYSEMLHGADAEATRRGYHLLISSAASAEVLKNGASALGLVDGLAVMIAQPDKGLWASLRRAGLPLVVLDTDPGEPGVDSIVVDNAGGAAEATRHLLHSVPPGRCFFVGGPAENFDTVQRAAAFRAAVASTGHNPRVDQFAYREYSADWGRHWAAERLRPFLNGGPAGVFAADDEIAYGILDGALELGLRCPRDLRIVGFDDTRLASLIRPRLSTVRIPLLEMGIAAIDLLVRRLEDPAAPAQCRRLPTRLIVRESSMA